MSWGFEWRTRAQIYGWPLVHVAVGRAENGRMRVAKGVVAIGQFAVGLVTFAQFGVGVLFGFGQFMLGLTAIAQFAGTLIGGLGQFVTGYVAIGQMFIAWYGLGQMGLAPHAWMMGHADPAAVTYFCELFVQMGITSLPEACPLPPAEMPISP